MREACCRLVICGANAVLHSYNPTSSSEIMGFAGAAPEITNARLAMVGLIAAAAAEVATGVPAVEQASRAPVSVISTVVLLITATLIPAA